MMCLLSGRPNTEDLELIRTRKPEEPKLEVTLKDGSKRNVWCTFGPQQIDIDVASPSGLPLGDILQPQSSFLLQILHAVHVDHIV